jgi:hypothetical protein
VAFVSWTFSWISFDMSRDGLKELSAILEPTFMSQSEEFKNFSNEIRNMVQRAPVAKPFVKEPSWLDE